MNHIDEIVKIANENNVSKGSIVVVGGLYGSAQAGAAGRTDVFVAALSMEPQKLRIGGRNVKPVIGGSYSWAKL